MQRGLCFFCFCLSTIVYSAVLVVRGFINDNQRFPVLVFSRRRKPLFLDTQDHINVDAKGAFVPDGEI